MSYGLHGLRTAWVTDRMSGCVALAFDRATCMMALMTDRGLGLEFRLIAWNSFLGMPVCLRLLMT